MGAGVTLTEPGGEAGLAARRTRSAAQAGSVASQLEADAIVWACGAWLSRLFPRLVPLHVTLQQLVLFDAPGEWRGPGWVDFEGPYYGHALVEPHGFKVASDLDGPAVDPDERPLEAPPHAVNQARRYLRHRFPALAGAPVRSAPTCHYSLTPDGQFIFARHPEHDRVWLLGGGSGHGFKQGPALAEHAAAVISGRSEPEPRFALGERAPSRSLRTAGSGQAATRAN